MGAAHFPIFDADNHYYEPLDCFTRHIEAKHRHKAVHYVFDGDQPRILVGNKPYSYGSIYVDRCPRAGSLIDFLKTLKKGAEGIQSDTDQPMPAEYQNRNARLAVMDAQGVESAILLPTLGVTVEHFMKDDVEQTYANLRAFNRFIEDDWGYAHQDRIFAAAMLSLLDLDEGVAELERVLREGARIIHLVAGPQAGRSPADPVFDPFWARVTEANAIVAFHSGESGYNELYSTAWGEEANPSCFEQSAFQWMNFFGDRPIIEVLTSLVFMNLFARFPTLRVASIEHGSIWVRYLLESIDKKKGMARNGPWPGGRLERRPSEIFKEHVYVAPFPEDDVIGLVDLLGVERVLGGSDYPHAEGLAEPHEFFDVIADLSTEHQRLVMRENARGLVGLP